MSGLSHTAVAHVRAAEQGLNLQHDTVDCMSHDDVSGLLLVAKGSVVFAFDLAGQRPQGCHDQLRFATPLADGPRVTAMRCSGDGRMLSLQRGARLIEFVEVATGNMFVAGSDKGRR